MFNNDRHADDIFQFGTEQVLNIEILQEIIVVDEQILLPESMQCSFI